MRGPGSGSWYHNWRPSRLTEGLRLFLYSFCRVLHPCSQVTTALRKSTHGQWPQETCGYRKSIAGPVNIPNTPKSEITPHGKRSLIPLHIHLPEHKPQALTRYGKETTRAWRDQIFPGPVFHTVTRQRRRKKGTGRAGHREPGQEFLSSCFFISRILVSISSEYGVTR
jgi:hypothetical protein